MRFIYMHARVYLYISIMFVLVLCQLLALCPLFNSTSFTGRTTVSPMKTLKKIKPSAIGKTVVLDPSIE